MLARRSSDRRQRAPSSFLNASLAAFRSGPSSSVRTRMVSTIRYMMLSNTLQQEREWARQLYGNTGPMVLHEPVILCESGCSCMRRIFSLGFIKQDSKLTMKAKERGGG